MITSNTLQRTFYIKYSKFLGTGFTFERNQVQYLVTTGHTFPFTEHNQNVEFMIMHNNKWEVINSKIYKHHDINVDIVVLCLPNDISARLPMYVGTNTLIYAQDCYFLGFPYGKFIEDSDYINKGYPIPFVKKGIFSTIPFKKENLELFYVDGLNNPGFSGGPCIFYPVGQTTPSVAGVVKGYFPHIIDVKTPLGEYTFEENSGLVEVHSIKHLSEIEF